MPYPASFLRHTMLWTLPGGEVASTSCAWKNTSTFVSSPLTEASLILGRGDSLWNDIKAQYSNQVAYVGGRVAWVAVDGHTVETFDGAVTAVPGFGSEPTLPTEVAVCASLRSATNSRSGRGRMYLPCTKQSSLASSGRLATANVDAIADGLAAYLADIPSGSEVLSPCIASKTTFTLPTVITLKVGDVFDAQRRRRDALSEVYSVRSL